MKKLSVLFLLLSLIFSASVASALPQYTLNTTDGRTGSGGPFQITGVTDPSVSFQTFCIEYYEYITLGGTYYGSISPTVYYSSGASPASSATINPNTAILYNYFLDNQYSPTLTNLQKSQIQLAIWMFQDQIADDATNWFYANVSTLHPTERTILALNLWGQDVGDGPYDTAAAYSARRQSMLTAVPEPGTLLLLGIGLVGLARVSRKK